MTTTIQAWWVRDDGQGSILLAEASSDAEAMETAVREFRASALVGDDDYCTDEGETLRGSIHLEVA